MKLLKCLFKKRINKSTVYCNAKILYSNCQTINEGCFRYTIELDEHISVDQINEIISKGIKNIKV